MENSKKNFGGHAARKRFFGWVMDNMTASDAFDIMYGEEGRGYPEEMKQEFEALYAKTMELKVERKSFMEKWKEYAPEGRGFGVAGQFGGEHAPDFGERGFHGHGNGQPGRGHGFGW